LIAGLPGAHLLQSYEWSQVKARYGWQPLYLVWTQGQAMTFSQNPAALQGLDPANVLATALIQKRNVICAGFAARLCILYCPRRPVLATSLIRQVFWIFGWNFVTSHPTKPAIH
jgi:hypothetical protein